MVKNYQELEVSCEEFSNIIKTSESLLVVDFFAEWCMPCLMLSPIIEDLSEQLTNVKFIKINIEDHEELAQKFKVTTIPCLIIFKNGIEIDRIIGAHSSEIIENKINNLLN